MNNKRFYVGFATEQEELNEAYRLRYEDMVLEYDQSKLCENGLDVQPCDEYAKHIVVKDLALNGRIVGYYRMLPSDVVQNGKKFICETEYNIDNLKSRKDKICEFSRAVIKKEYRGGTIILLLWQFIIDYMRSNNFRYLIGTASFVGTDRSRYLKEISYLVNNYSISNDYQIVSKDPMPNMPLLSPDEYDDNEVLRLIPPLFKAYMSIGGKVSRQTFTDLSFCSVDLFVLVDLQNCNNAFIDKLMSFAKKQG